MKRLNIGLLDTIKSTFATLNYKGEYKLVKKAREANEVLAKALTTNGFKVAEKGDACPFNSVIKQSTYTVSLGGSLNYKRRVESVAKSNGIECDYKPSQKKLGMFPIYSEMLWVKDDLSEVYIRCYQVSKPTPKFFANGKEIKKLAFGQWATSDDFKALSGEWVAPSLLGDEDGDIIFAQDEDGNILRDDSGEPIAIALPPLRAVKLSNCEIFRKGKKLDFFTDEEWDENELVAIRDAYYAKFAEN